MAEERVGRQMTVKAAAKEGGCHIETIRRAIRTRELAARRDPFRIGHPYLIYAEDLKAMMKRRSIA